MIWIKFIICAAVILFAGKRVAKYGDAIAEKTGLGGLWIGVVLVSIATSLPELFTGVGSTVFINAPDLTVGNLFGANTYNLVNIAFLDIINKGAPLLSVVSSGQLLTAGLSLIPISIAAFGIMQAPQLGQAAVFNISLFSLLILISYLIASRIIFVYEKKERIINKLDQQEDEVFKYGNLSLKTITIRYVLAAVAIAGAGIWLAYIGDELSQSLNLGQNFIGSLFLGFVTTLPEITVSIAAIRIGARELALANMLGSNLFNIAIIFINDALYRKAPIFSVLSERHTLPIITVVLMTAVLITGLILKPQKKTRLGISLYAIILIGIFIAGVYANFIFQR